MTKEELIAQIKQVEKDTWYPRGRDIDGAPYSCIPQSGIGYPKQ